MGGEASKFKATNWTRAKGGLVASAVNETSAMEEGTVDGAKPTNDYQVFHLMKRSSLTMDQREFEVVLDPSGTSSSSPSVIHSNDHSHAASFRYTTRAVPGSLTSFDVLRPIWDNGGNHHLELLLRVRSDKSRRTWNIFRHRTPCFEGQRPATATGENIRMIVGEDSWYKAACITVSNSRYGAVVARYGPPSVAYLFHLDPSDTNNKSDEGNDDDDAQENCRNDRFSNQNNGGKEDDARSRIAPNLSSDSHDELLTAAEMLATRRRQSSNTFLLDATQSATSTIKTTADINTTNHQDDQETIRNEQPGPLRDWAVLEERRKLAYRNAMQGVVDLNNHPLLVCQEIYNMTIGNHQTSLITKDHLKRLVQWDVQQKSQQQLEPQQQRQDGDESNTIAAQPRYNSNPIMLALRGEERIDQFWSCEAQTTATRQTEDQPPSRNHDPCHRHTNEFEDHLASIMAKKNQPSTLQYWFGYNGDGAPPPFFGSSKRNNRTSYECDTIDSKMEASQTASPSEKITAQSQNEKINLQEEKSESEAIFPTQKQQALPALSVNDKALSTSATKLLSPVVSPSPDTKEPLVSYWSWKNSVTVHKMELHLAKESDLALHVVLAIVCNQVRCERNAWP